jgi:hypothetical protein
MALTAALSALVALERLFEHGTEADVAVRRAPRRRPVTAGV